MKLTRGVFLFTLPCLVGFGGDLTKLEKFFETNGVIVAKSENSLYVCDKGLPFFRKGFPVAIYRGTYVENPLTGKKKFVIVSQTAKGQVFQSFKESSLIKVSEDKGVKIGDICKLDYSAICFSGSKVVYEKLQNKLPLVWKTQEIPCRWTIEETPNGFEILFKGQQVFFVEKQLPTYAYAPAKVSFRDLNIFVKPYELRDFKEIPVGVDAIAIGKLNLVAVAFPEKVTLYQRIGDTLTHLSDLPVPVGIIVGLRLVKVNNNIYLLGNAVTSDVEPVSFVAKLVGTNPVIIQKDIPYLFGVLRKGEKPLVVAQELKNGVFGKVYKVDLSGGQVSVGGKLNFPKGFRADTALLTSDDRLAFIDVGGTLKIYKGNPKEGFSHLMDIEGDFGKSYTAVDIPSVVGDTSFRKLYFPPPPVEIQLFGFKGFLVAQNVTEKIVPLFGEKVLKFKGGRLVFVGENSKGFYETKTLRGFEFEDALQGFAVDSHGTPFAVSGYKNPFLFKKGGKIYRLEFRYF
ncbi:MAG: hypothetical protein DSZ30_05255 [Aquificaceae bacterium]|nr:MAG: hypothetical protein DSZ30_05255 [Aquificaceae bacterium]